MEMMDAIFARRSVRAYKPVQIADSDLTDILQAGLLAPSGRNLRPIEFVVVGERGTLAQLARAKTSGSDMLAQAAAAIVVTGDTTRSDTCIEDGSIALAYMQLRATDLGLGSCWVQCRNRISKQQRDKLGDDMLMSGEYVASLLGIPTTHEVLAMLALGMPAEKPIAHTPDDADFGQVHTERF